jgi:hypothetical protein
MYACKKCNLIFETCSSVANHNRWHHKELKKFKCEKCEKVFTDNSSYVTHKKFCTGKKEKTVKYDICPKCGYTIKTGLNRHTKVCGGEGPRRFKKRHPGGQQWMKDKTFEELYGKDKADAIKASISENLKGNKNWEKLSEDFKINNKNRARKAILKRYEQGWLPKAGRCKKITYESPIAGVLKLDGSWELCVAIYLDSNNIKWKRNKIRFKYVNLKQKESYYTPDFFILDWNSYLEVKGYETELDKCKWSQFSNPIIIWKKSKLKVIKNFIKANQSCLDLYHKYYKKFSF